MIDIFNFKKYYKRKGDLTEAKIGHVNYALEQIGNSKPYKEYVAHITQSTGAPVAVIMQNDFDTVPVWSRIAMGEYILTFSETISQNKCFVVVNNSSYSSLSNSVEYLTAGFQNTSSIFVSSGYQARDTGVIATPTDGVLYKHTIMVRIYK